LWKEGSQTENNPHGEAVELARGSSNYSDMRIKDREVEKNAMESSPPVEALRKRIAKIPIHGKIKHSIDF
jgi:hypothetical protein